MAPNRETRSGPPGDARLTRRHFLFAGAAAALPPLLMTATRGARAQVPGPADPRRGGTLRVALAAEPTSLDIHATTDTLVTLVMSHVCETLFTWDADFRPIPLLARSHEPSHDGMTHVITLRERVRLHNGDELTAADVVASIQRWGTRSGLGKSLLAASREIVANGRYKLEIRLREPFAGVVVALARGNQGCVIYPKAVIDAAGSGLLPSFVGTGPYRLVERRADRFIRVLRFDDYTSPPGPANGYGGRKAQYLDQIDFIPVPDEAARLAGLRAGDYHYLERFSTDQYETLKGEANIVTQILPPVEWPTLVINTRSPLTGQLTIRRALQAALDHEAILQAGYGKGFFRLDPSLMFRETAWHTTAGKELYNIRDRARAQALLREARYDGTPLRLMFSQEYKNMHNEALVTQQQLEAAGFRVQPLVYDWATLLKHRSDEKQWDVCVAGFVFRADPATLPFLPSCSWPGWWCSEHKVALARRLQQAGDAATRRRLFEDVQRAFYEEVPAIKLGDGLGVTATASRLKGFDGRIQLEPEFSNVWLVP